jgi:hypothetical protein
MGPNCSATGGETGQTTAVLPCAWKWPFVANLTVGESADQEIALAHVGNVRSTSSGERVKLSITASARLGACFFHSRSIAQPCTFSLDMHVNGTELETFPRVIPDRFLAEKESVNSTCSRTLEKHKQQIQKKWRIHA